METSLFFGILVTAVGGLIMGTSPTPLKFMRRFSYEHFGLISMPLSLLIIPWVITLVFCPDVFSALSEIDRGVLIKANIFSLSWGIAQILAMLCFIRIGVSMTYGILCSIGAGVGVVIPMIFKASGVFSTAPDLFSRAGIIVLAGVLVMIAGVYLASVAGFIREKQLKKDKTDKQEGVSGGFATGLIMVIAAGVLSAGWGFTFAYSQGPITDAMLSRGASDFPAKIAVWAFVLPGAALVNTFYPVYLLTKKKSWNVLAESRKEIMLSALYGLLFFIPSIMMGKGMVMLGPLGASVGTGVTLGCVILGGQILGFASGEWKGVKGTPRKYIYSAIVVLVVSMMILAAGNWFA